MISGGSKAQALTSCICVLAAHPRGAGGNGAWHVGAADPGAAAEQTEAPGHRREAMQVGGLGLLWPYTSVLYVLILFIYFLSQRRKLKGKCFLSH